MISLDEALAIRWQAIVPDALYSPQAGFEKEWAKEENTWWGAPLTQFEDTMVIDGQERAVRIFANAIVAWIDGPRVIHP